MKKFCLLYAIALVGIYCYCKKRSYDPDCYLVPQIGMNIDIIRPLQEDSAYIHIYSQSKKHNNFECKFRVPRHECLDLRFFTNINNPDTIFYYDDWNDITFEAPHTNYVEIKDFHSPKFRSNKLDIKKGYIEVGIQDFAKWVFYKTDTIPYPLEPVNK